MKKFSMIALGLLTGALLTTGCKKSFLDRPLEDALTVDEFYKTDSEVDAATKPLYNAALFQWNDKAIWCIGDIASGNLTSGDNQVISFRNMGVSADNDQLYWSWSTLYGQIAQCNHVINEVSTKAASNGVSKTTIDRNVAEAKVMRALAYFDLVRIFGAIPIVENNLKSYATGELLPRNRVEDVYTLIIRDLKEAEAVLPLRSATLKGRAAQGSAQALLAKVYLAMRNYTEAKAYAAKVINSNQYGLMGLDFEQGASPRVFENLFLTKNKNSQESILAYQWFVDFARWGTQNTQQAYFAANWNTNGYNISGSWDCFGMAVPSLDLLAAFNASPGDRRRSGTIMEVGNIYPTIWSDRGGFNYTQSVANTSMTRVNVKKNVVGNSADNGGQLDGMKAPNNTEVIRFSEVLLTYAEATLGADASTTDATALTYFNKVRTRAGLPSVTSLTKDIILKERRLEFVAESQYWYDLCRLDSDLLGKETPHPLARAIIATQNRAGVNQGAQYLNLQDKDFLFPIPSNEIVINKKLIEPPVAYQF
jgi:starch-binding outer membrane protein, SusD/RagB family